MYYWDDDWFLRWSLIDTSRGGDGMVNVPDLGRRNRSDRRRGRRLVASVTASVIHSKSLAVDRSVGGCYGLRDFDDVECVCYDYFPCRSET